MKANKGFTLLESMIVLAIIAVGVAVAFPALQSNGSSIEPSENGRVVPNQPASGSASSCAKVSESAEGAVHKCPDGTVLLVK